MTPSADLGAPLPPPAEPLPAPVLDATASAVEPEVVPAPEPARRGRGKIAVAIGAVGVLVLFVLAVVVGRSLGSGGGGAASPEAAVDQLATAVSKEDPVAALAVMAPDEVEGAKALVTTALAKAKQFGFAGTTGAGAVPGIDLDVTNLQTSVAPLSSGVARVTLTEGSVSASVDPKHLPARIQAITRDASNESTVACDSTYACTETVGQAKSSSTTSDVATWLLHDDKGHPITPSVVTVRHNGRWYVSPAYTIADDITRVNGLAAPTFAETHGASGGGETPVKAVDAFVRTALALDASKAIDSVSSADARLLEPVRASIIDGIKDAKASTSISVDALQLTDEGAVAGGRAVEVHKITGAATSHDESGAAQHWTYSYDGRCFTLHGDSPGWKDAPICSSASGGNIIRFVAVNEDGAWRVSPTMTVLEIARRAVDSLTENQVLGVLSLFDQAAVTGSMTLGSSVNGTVNDGNFAVYTVDATKGQVLHLSAVLNGSNSAADQGPFPIVLVYSPDGRPLELRADSDNQSDNPRQLAASTAALPASGTYKVVVVSADLLTGLFSFLGTLGLPASAPTFVLSVKAS
jgi:hypothetical protein